MRLIFIGCLAVLTEIYLILSSLRDLKERMIYTFPANILIALWLLLLKAANILEPGPLLLYLLIQVASYAFFHYFHVWGDGDTDMLMLFSSAMPIFVTNRKIMSLILQEALGVIFVLAVAIIISIIESYIRGKNWNIHEKAAVVPGFAVAIIVMFITGFMRGNVV